MIKMKNILTENMRRFNTKNLKENIKTDSELNRIVKKIQDGASRGEMQTDMILAELGDFYTAVYKSGDTELIRLYNQLRMSADETPDIQRYSAEKLFSYLNGNSTYSEGSYNEESNDDIDSIIESILAAESTETKSNVSKLQSDLNEAYSTINQLRSVINEVNLLNAKLLYTNKLFRNFELEETQKMKVIENFDRASNTREVKLVFSTLAESFKKPAGKKRVVKESYASKPARTTAPSKQVTQQILSEGSDLAARWKKLAGLL
jgi:hypothetical protein